MLVALVVVGIAVALLLLYGAVAFNALVRMRNECDQAFADIDVELKRRHDLIPNLIETVKGYAGHERQVLENVTEARSRAVSASGPEAQARADSALGGALRQLFAVAENYPELKADRNFRELQGELADTEDRIESARQFYNASVREMNVSVESFPSSVIARLTNMPRREFFELAEPTQSEAPQVSFGRSRRS
jgi:LemA protein